MDGQDEPSPGFGLALAAAGFFVLGVATGFWICVAVAAFLLVAAIMQGGNGGR
jgi:hypothetical protein